MQVADDDDRCHFSSLSVNPRGQLCLRLNRPLVMAMTVGEVVTMGTEYGRTNVSQTGCKSSSLYSTGDGYKNITLIHHISRSCCQSGEGEQQGVPVFSDQSSHASRGEATPTSKTVQLNELSLNEGRSLLVLGLVVKLLQVHGHSVSHYTDIPQVVPADDPSYPVWHLLRTMLPTEFKVQTGATPMTEDFIRAISSLPQHTAMSRRALELDAQGFCKHIGLSGKGGYDKNLAKIQVTDASGRLTTAAENASNVCSTLVSPVGGASHMTVYVAEQQKSFAMQQSMLISEAYLKATQQQLNQHILVCSGVNSQDKGRRKTQECTLSELMRIRLDQMTEAYVVKYGARAKGTQLQNIATRMAEAVVKFELLSNNPSSNIKLQLPELKASPDFGTRVTSSHTERDLRFDGSFVMYNYARIATILSHFKQECEKGTYSSLPELSDINFSLLKEEEEWQLLFQFVLQYPMMLREVTKMKKKGVGIHIEMSLKKVCQFLTKLSHTFSCYYSRVKVLMPPEPHLLPLIHARLYLVTAIRQVMDNGLALLAIEPLEQL